MRNAVQILAASVICALLAALPAYSGGTKKTGSTPKSNPFLKSPGSGSAGKGSGSNPFMKLPSGGGSTGKTPSGPNPFLKGPTTGGSTGGTKTPTGPNPFLKSPTTGGGSTGGTKTPAGPNPFLKSPTTGGGTTGGTKNPPPNPFLKSPNTGGGTTGGTTGGTKNPPPNPFLKSPNTGGGTTGGVKNPPPNPFLKSPSTGGGTTGGTKNPPPNPFLKSGGSTGGGGTKNPPNPFLKPGRQASPEHKASMKSTAVALNQFTERNRAEIDKARAKLPPAQQEAIDRLRSKAAGQQKNTAIPNTPAPLNKTQLAGLNKLAAKDPGLASALKKSQAGLPLSKDEKSKLNSALGKLHGDSANKQISAAGGLSLTGQGDNADIIKSIQKNGGHGFTAVDNNRLKGLPPHIPAGTAKTLDQMRTDPKLDKVLSASDRSTLAAVNSGKPLTEPQKLQLQGMQDNPGLSKDHKAALAQAQTAVQNTDGQKGFQQGMLGALSNLGGDGGFPPMGGFGGLPPVLGGANTGGIDIGGGSYVPTVPGVFIPATENGAMGPGLAITPIPTGGIPATDPDDAGVNIAALGNLTLPPDPDAAIQASVELGSVASRVKEGFDVRALTVANTTKQEIDVYVRYLTTVDGELQWNDGPEDRGAVKMTLAPGQTAPFMDGTVQVRASKIQFWVRSPNLNISTFETRDLTLVPEEGGFYQAPAIQGVVVNVMNPKAS